MDCIESRKHLASSIDAYRGTTRALNGSRIDLNCASVPSSALNINSSDKVSVDTGCGIIAPVIIDGELLPSWVAADTLGRARHRILAAHGKMGGPRRIRFENFKVWVGMQRILRQSLGRLCHPNKPGAFRTEHDVPMQTNWLVQDLPRRDV
jgi:hypothetical protein